MKVAVTVTVCLQEQGHKVVGTIAFWRAVAHPSMSRGMMLRMLCILFSLSKTHGTGPFVLIISSETYQAHQASHLKSMSADKKYSKGLVGVIAGTSSTCDVGPGGHGLFYRGYNVEDLAQHCTFEEVASSGV
jgi:hypothetical protein